MPAPRPHSLALRLSLAGAVVLWGTSFVALKSAMASFSPMTVMWMRMAVATVVILPFWRRIPKPAYRPGDWKLLGMSALFLPCLYYLLEGYAIRFTTSSQAGVISAIAPLIVAVGAWIFLRERLTGRGAAAIVVSLVGVAALSLGGAAQETASNPALGNGLEVMAMFAAAGSTLSVKHLTRRYSPWLITGMQAAVGAVFFLPFALADGPAAWVSAPPEAWAWVLYLGTAVSLAAFGLYNTALREMSATGASIAINAIPGVALVAGWALLGESLTTVQLVACAVIVGAVVFAQTGPEPIEPAPEVV